MRTVCGHVCESRRQQGDKTTGDKACEDERTNREGEATRSGILTVTNPPRRTQSSIPVSQQAQVNSQDHDLRLWRRMDVSEPESKKTRKKQVRRTTRAKGKALVQLTS
jgi:hypothetical protein